MISLLRGRIAERGLDHVILDVGGVGFRVGISLQTMAELPAVGGEATLLTYLKVAEDALTLFGFAREQERTAFELCLSVQQVGPKLAMSILSSLTPEQLAAAIEREEVARLKKIPGVGQKTAERLALELRDKFDKAGIRSAARLPAAGRPGPGGADAGTVAQIASALTNLGYRAQEAERAAAQVVEAASGSQPGVAELVKRALRQLAE